MCAFSCPTNKNTPSAPTGLQGINHTATYLHVRRFLDRRALVLDEAVERDRPVLNEEEEHREDDHAAQDEPGREAGHILRGKRFAGHVRDLRA